MEAVKKAQERLAKYPLVFAKCTKTATLYARCVLLKDEGLKKNDCAKEFEAFNACLKTAAKELKTRI
ncbi:uncharacterized protein LOC121737942 [Aricia agestis]|uniref:uncharacterized protein LOC121737942 n=1 Tax=Aricia agestis TaxID=91739 RepID=UPI001C2054EE|nr:uncharacterized protein LOC121737942 [Aricia agestis]